MSVKLDQILTMKEIKVSVVMISYGHENFIEQAIKGVLSQVCDFGIELIIANDNSPDKTDQVVRRVIDTEPNSFCIKYINRDRNIGMIANFLDTLRITKGEYIAICDGDDYWIDVNKLQSQVDFLNRNSEYSFHCTNFLQLSDKKSIFSKPVIEARADFDITLDSFLDKSMIGTLTVLARAEIFKGSINKFGDSEISQWGMADYPIWLEMLKNSKGRFMNVNTSVYRILENSATGRHNFEKEFKFQLSALDILSRFFKNNSFNFEQSKYALIKRYEEIFSLISQKGSIKDFNSTKSKMIEQNLEITKSIKLSYVKLRLYPLLNIYRHIKGSLNA